jgi:TrmH family RNA methyltransferase
MSRCLLVRTVLPASRALRHRHSRPVAAAGAAAADTATELLTRFSVVLCDTQGPQNLGAVARLCQNFGVHDLRVVNPGAFVVDTATGAFAAEASDFAVSARWLLDASARHTSTTAAVGDATLVLATSARARDPSMRLLSPREAAAQAVATAAAGGRVALLFGSERTGLSNDDLALAHAVVAIPTAVKHDSDAGVGAGGKYSLNLSHAVGILVYELLQATERHVAAVEGLEGSAPSEAGGIATPADADAGDYLDTSGRSRLVASLTEAVRSLDVLRHVDAEGDAAVFGEPTDTSARDAHDARALARAVSGATMSKRGAKPLFALARRVVALARLQNGAGPLDDHLLRLAATALRDAGLDVAAAAPPSEGDASPTRAAAAQEARDECVRVLRTFFRGGSGPGLEGDSLAELNITKRELHRIIYVLSTRATAAQ